MKFKKGEIEIELTNPNTFNIAEREGFVKVEEEKPKKKADHKEE